MRGFLKRKWGRIRKKETSRPTSTPFVGRTLRAWEIRGGRYVPMEKGQSLSETSTQFREGEKAKAGRGIANCSELNT